jgi:hypothetical protein
MTKLTIMRNLMVFPLLLAGFITQAQVVYPKKGFEEINLGITYEDVIWILGFDGAKMNKDSAPQMLAAPASELGVDYDYVVNFRYIMDYPVTSIYFKGNLVVMFTLSSYPEYNQFICQDIQTSNGLKFWDNLDKIKSLYGTSPGKLSYSGGNLSYYSMKSTGICFGIDNSQVRTMLIFNPDFK